MTKFETSAVRPAPTPPVPTQVGRLGGRVGCTARPSSISSFENGRQDEEPGAKLAGNGTHGIAPRENHRVATMEGQSTKFRGTLLSERRGTARHSMRRNLYAENPQNTSAMSTLTTQELTKEVQCLVLQFRTNEVVEDTQASLRAIENIRNGESGMSLKTFVNLCRRNPRARALVAPMLGYGLESDPNVVQAISILMNHLVRTDDVVAAEPDSSDELADDEGNLAVGDLFEGRK